MNVASISTPCEDARVTSGARPSLVPAPRRGRGRRPAGEVRSAILDAAGRLLLAEGMAAFTIERVAELAAVSKATIYKWWASRGVLALEAYAAGVDGTLAVPDSRDIAADLTANLLTFSGLLRGTRAGRVFAQLVGEAQVDPLLAEALAENYTRPRRAVGLAAMRAAQVRGQIRADADLDALTDQLWGAVLYRLLLDPGPLDERFVRSLVANVMDGVRA